MSRGQWAVIGALAAAVAAVFLVVVIATAGGGDDPSAETAAVTSVPLPATTLALITLPPTTTEPPTTEPPTTTAPAAATTTRADAATTTTGGVTTTAVAAGTPLVLIPGGFQTVPFGVEPEVALARVALAFGDPTGDTGWVPAQDLGPCPGDEVRLVSWGELSLLFSNEVAPFAVPGSRHFTSWIYTGPASPADPGLMTFAGIGLGSTRADLDAAYGPRLAITEDDLFGPSFQVDFEPGQDDFIYLSGALTDATPDGIVIGLSAGRSCGE